MEVLVCLPDVGFLAPLDSEILIKLLKIMTLGLRRFVDSSAEHRKCARKCKGSFVCVLPISLTSLQPGRRVLLEEPSQMCPPPNLFLSY